MSTVLIMSSEKIFISRIEKALANGNFPSIEEGDSGDVYVIHEEGCVSDDDGDRSNCNCIPVLMVLFKNQKFTIDPEGIVSNHVIN